MSPGGSSVNGSATAPREPAAVPDLACAARLLEMIGGGWAPQVIASAAEIGLADHLAGGPCTAGALAVATHCDPGALHRLLRALAALGLVDEGTGGTFTLTTLGSLLRVDAQPSLRSHALWWGRHLWPVWARLTDSVRTGTSVRELMTGRRGFAHLDADAQAAGIFHRSMSEMTQLVAADIVRVVDVAAATTWVDVGGGYGEMLVAVLAAHPHLHGVLVDLPHALDGALARAMAAGVASRLSVVAGSFFESVPAAADVYLLKSVLHDWDDAHCARILDTCRRAMTATASLVVVERLMPVRMVGDTAEHSVARSDLNMLVALGGRERTQDEFVALLAGSGFAAPRFTPTPLGYCVIEAAPRPMEPPHSAAISLLPTCPCG